MIGEPSTLSEAWRIKGAPSPLLPHINQYGHKAFEHLFHRSPHTDESSIRSTVILTDHASILGIFL